ACASDSGTANSFTRSSLGVHVMTLLFVGWGSGQIACRRQIERHCSKFLRDCFTSGEKEGLGMAAITYPSRVQSFAPALANSARIVSHAKFVTAVIWCGSSLGICTQNSSAYGASKAL